MDWCLAIERRAWVGSFRRCTARPLRLRVRFCKFVTAHVRFVRIFTDLAQFLLIIRRGSSFVSACVPPFPRLPPLTGSLDSLLLYVPYAGITASCLGPWDWDASRERRHVVPYILTTRVTITPPNLCSARANAYITVFVARLGYQISIPSCGISDKSQLSRTA